MPSIAGPAGPIHYIEQGSGPPLLLSHGVIENTRSWDRVTPLLARRFRAVAHDARGRGRSGVARMTFDDLVEDVLTLVQTLELGPVFHAGHSMGGRVALEHALADPDGVRAIAMVSGRAGAPDAAGRRRLEALADRVAHEGSATAVEPWIDPGHPLYETVRAISAANPPEGTRSALRCLATAGSIEPQLDALRAPALIVVGADDRPVYGSAAGSLTEQIPDAELIVLDGVGHFPNLEAPNELAGALERFFLSQSCRRNGDAEAEGQRPARPA